jgi:ketosteroid isomerase-like protein
VSSVDSEHRRLCHTLLDAIEHHDFDGVMGCYAPDMTMWFNVTGEESSREENLVALVSGEGLHRRRTYDDRIVDTFVDGFVARYTCRVVGHDGTVVALSACLVAEVHDGRIVKLFEYLDSGRFRPRPRRAPAGRAS